MNSRWLRPIIFFIFLLFFLSFTLLDPVLAGPSGQQPTVDIPTVTSTPRGPYILVNALTATDR